MSKFKKGDKVRRIKEEHEGMVVGDVATVRGVGPGKYDIALEGYEFKHDANNFELVDNTKEQIKQWLQNNPWFIRVNNQEEFDLIQEWLLENFGANLKWKKCFTNGMQLTNTTFDGGVDAVYWGSGNNRLNTKEIFPKFKMTLESVTLPEVKTEQQIKLEELETTIAKAQTEIKALKEMK